MDGAELARTIEAAVNASLGPGMIQITDFQLIFPPEDLEAMRPVGFAPRTRVLATWSDGRTFPATVRSFNGTQVEIVWDGSTESTWLPAASVRNA